MKTRNDFCKPFDPNNFESFRFLPIDFIFGYKDVRIIGITKYGARAMVVVDNPPIFVDILPKKNNEFINYNNEDIEYISGREFGPPIIYKRIYFENFNQRREFMKQYVNYDMTSNDKNYELLFLRVSKMNSAGWNKVSKYIVINSPDKIKLPICVKVSFENIEAENNLTEEFLYDKSIICSWDLETYTPDIYGGIPDPYKKTDKIKMCAMAFRFYNSKEDLYRVLIVDTSLKDIDIKDYYIIRTNDIPMAMAKVLSNMQPDFITGFNDGFYDWPFIKERTTDKNLFLDTVSPIALTSYQKTWLYGEYKINGMPRAPMTKIDAQNNVFYNGYIYPGCICFDISTILRKNNKTETDWKLNTFLKKYGLDSKYDMPYDKMSRIFHLCELTDKNKILSLDNIPYATDKKRGGIAIYNLTREDILEHFNSLNDVGIYCMRDAAACLDIIYKINTIPDIRETCNKSNTPTIYGFYRADGIKVRNMIYTYAMQPIWGCWEKKYPIAFDTTTTNGDEKRKYPGGHVIQPKRDIYNATMLERKFPGMQFDKLNPQSEDYIFKDRDPVDVYEELKKEGIFSHRPCTGEDFSSLYPSLIMCYNFSPEYYTTKLHTEYTEYKWLKIKTHYKLEEDEKNDGNKYEGYFLQQTLIGESAEGEEFKNHGIFPVILRKLFAERKKIKVDMNKWSIIQERYTRDFIPYIKAIKYTGEITLELLQKCIDEKIQAIKIKMENYQGKKRELEEAKIKNYISSMEIISTEWSTFEDLQKRSQFKYNYYNSKQNALKVFMNTFYGETGNPKSPFFIVCMSGGITKMGRHSLKSIKKFVEEKGYTVLYGDTDSIYPTCPEAIFYEADIKYLRGQINKETYYEEMVGITMNNLKELSGEIAKYFKQKTGNNFLRMEYEEVLFPYGLMGKKNYFGVAHMTSIDFSLCKSPSIETFNKDIFARGIATRRRDGSKFAKRELNNILIRFCDLQETRRPEQIIKHHIEYLLKDTFQNPQNYVELLYKNYSFRKTEKNAHTSQMKFRDRMIYHYIKMEQIKTRVKEGQEITDAEKNYLHCEFKTPNFGDRCDLIVVRKPKSVNDRGLSFANKMGELLEYPEFIGNKYYASIIRNELLERNIKVDFEDIEIDFSYYFKELYGKVSRYLMYLPHYADLLKDKIKEYSKKHFLRKAIKTAEGYVITKIKNDLKNLYANYFPVINCDSSVVKEKFKILRNEFESITGKSKFISLIIKYLTETYEIKKLLNDVDKLYKIEPKHKILLPPHIAKINRKPFTDEIEKRKQILRLNISALCNEMSKKMNIKYANRILQLNEDFYEIRAMIYLEYIIEEEKKDMRGEIDIKVIQNIDIQNIKEKKIDLLKFIHDF